MANDLVTTKKGAMKRLREIYRHGDALITKLGSIQHKLDLLKGSASMLMAKFQITNEDITGVKPVENEEFISSEKVEVTNEET